MYRALLFAFFLSTLFLSLPFVPGALSQDAGAAEQQSAGSKTDLDEMVVTAGRVPEPKRVIPANITVIDEVAISQSTAVDLGELLAQNGFDVRQYPGTLTTIGIRGFRTDSHGNDLKGNVLILLNGRRAGTGNAAKIMTKNIERIEVIRGPASVQYGSAAMGGVVNVITKRGSGEFSAFADGRLGSFDFMEGSVGLSGETRGFDYSGSVTTGSWDDYTTAGGSVYKNTGIDSRSSGSLNLGYTFADVHRLGVIVTAFDADKSGSPSYLVENDLDDYSDKTNTSVDLTYEGQTLSSRYLWSARYFTGEDEDIWADPTASDPSGWDDGENSHRKIDSQGAQAQVTGQWDIARVTLGMDWIDYDIDYSYTPQRSTYENIAGFLLGRMGFLDDRLTASAGLRYDRYEVEMVEPSGNTEDDSNLGVNLGLAYLANDWLKLRAGYSTAFIMPSADELAADYTSGSTTYQGNPDLDPETSATYEGGLDLAFDAVTAGVTYFYTDYKDMIESVSTGTNTRSWENVGKARIQGFEGDFGWDIARTFHWGFSLRPYVSLTWLTEYKDREDGSDLKYTPDLMTSYGIVFSGFNGFSCRLNATYTGGKRADDWINNTGEFTQGSHTVVDFSLSQVLMETEKRGKLSLNAGINNMLDEDYEYVHGFPMPERNFYLGVRYTY
ncbi:MAG: TonB-dependent receptor [Desulfobacterales bacterium]|nr:TonB-dependent receptor [Desulfobacterales bacterium]